MLAFLAGGFLKRKEHSSFVGPVVIPEGVSFWCGIRKIAGATTPVDFQRKGVGA